MGAEIPNLAITHRSQVQINGDKFPAGLISGQRQKFAVIDLELRESSTLRIPRVIASVLPEGLCTEDIACR